jgi:hypothetical protein
MQNEQQGCFVCKLSETIQNLWEKIMGGLFQQKNTIRISPQDWKDQYLVNKLVPGENVSLVERNDAYNGRQIVITANKTQGRQVQFLNADGVVNHDTYLVVVDASANPVTVTLPVAHDFLGPLSIVCADASNAITLAPNGSTQNVIFDTSNIEFHARGDSLTLVNDGGESAPPAPDALPNAEIDANFEADFEASGAIQPGTWYVVGRYAAVWYA